MIPKAARLNPRIHGVILVVSREEPRPGQGEQEKRGKTEAAVGVTGEEGAGLGGVRRREAGRGARGWASPPTPGPLLRRR